MLFRLSGTVLVYSSAWAEASHMEKKKNFSSSSSHAASLVRSLTTSRPFVVGAPARAPPCELPGRGRWWVPPPASRSL